jgi:hypothetical protein
MPIKDDQLITVNSAAAMIGLSVKTIYSGKCLTNELLRIPISPRKFLLSRNDVLAWIERRKDEAIKAQIDKLERRRSLLNDTKFNKQSVVAILQDFKSKSA